MAALALALVAPAVANDNPSKGVDKSRFIIDRFTAIEPSLGVIAAQEKLRGATVEEFCHSFMLAAKSVGWQCAQDYV